MCVCVHVRASVGHIHQVVPTSWHIYFLEELGGMADARFKHLSHPMSHVTLNHRRVSKLDVSPTALAL